MPQAISETVSKKRGRPVKFGRELIAGYRSIFPDVTTERGIQDTTYMIRAFGILKADPAFAWVVNSVPNEKGVQTMRRVILAALGRIEDDNKLREAAAWVCEHKPTSKRAAAVLRNWRRGKDGDGDARALAMAILKTINVYSDTHPAATMQQVYTALDLVRSSYGQP